MSEKIKNSRILVIGGAGLIGSFICDLLLKEEAREVIVLDNFSTGCEENLREAFESGRLRIVRGDIRFPKVLDSYCEGIDYIFHQAAIKIIQCAKNPQEAHDVLTTGTLNILQAALKNKVKKIVAASSASVYGEALYLPIDEKHPFNNRTMYGACKIADEQYYRAFYEMHKLDYVALRYFAVYGPRMDTSGVYTEVMISWLNQIEKGNAPVIFGDGQQFNDFVFVKDVARANILALEADVTDRVFNVGTGIKTSLNELLPLMLELLGRTDLKPIHKENRHAHIRERLSTIALAEKMLGYRPVYSLKEGLRELIEWKKSLPPVRL